MSFTETLVVGNLGADPKLRALPNGTPVASFSICANERRGSGPNKTEIQQWFTANIFGNSANAVMDHLAKGDLVAVKGRLDPDIWIGRDSKPRLTMNLNSSDVKFLGKRRTAGEPADEAEGSFETDSADPNGDDIPF